MLDRPLSRPIRKVAADFVGGICEVFTAGTRIASIQITANGGDVPLSIKNGLTGEILHDIEADASAGTNSIEFGPYPSLYTQGVTLEGDQATIDSFLKGVTVNLVEPQATGT